MTHTIKAWRDPFQAMWDRKKLFEFRKDDRGYEVGDYVIIHETDENAEYVLSGRRICGTISFALKGPSFGVPVGYVVLSLDIECNLEAGK